MHIALWFLLSLVHAGVTTTNPNTCAAQMDGRELAHPLEHELYNFRQALLAVQPIDQYVLNRWKQDHPNAHVSKAPVSVFRGALFSQHYPVLLDRTRRLVELLSVFGDKPAIVKLQARLMELRDHLSAYAAIDEMREHALKDGTYDEELKEWLVPGGQVDFSDRVKGRVVTAHRELIKWMVSEYWMSITGELTTVVTMLTSVNETWPAHDVVRTQLEDSLQFNLSRLAVNASASRTVNVLLKILQIERIERTELGVKKSLVSPALEYTLQAKILPLAKEVRDLELMSELPRAPEGIKLAAQTRAAELRGAIQQLLNGQ